MSKKIDLPASASTSEKPDPPVPPSGKSELPAAFKGLVLEVGAKVTPKDVDTFGRLTDIHDRSHWLRTIVDSWEQQQKQDREMRGRYAICLVVAMLVQAVVVNAAFFLIGFEKLKVDQWTARTFILAVFGEIAAMVFFIVKYLFRPTGDKVLELVRPKGRTGTTRGKTKDVNN